ncbi:MAG: dynamin family protein [Anaerolineae bacterium]|nr:dynamin family protein [Anaerolineae bacterium]
MRILTDEQDQLLQEERKLLSALWKALTAFGAEPDDLETMEQSVQQLDALFLLVVVGEFNAGKSAFINALLGQPLLQEGVTPTTTQVHILRYGEAQGHAQVDEHQAILTLPAEMLAEISIVDTPGTNAVIREHETITNRFVPRADIILFVTSADRPFTESERAFLERIRDWGKKVVLVINKIDILQDDDEFDQVRTFVTQNAFALLGLQPDVFGISARAALRAKLGEPRLWEGSRFEPLERYVHRTLDDLGRIRLKFLNPLGVGDHLIDTYLARTGARLALLQSDFALLADVESQLALYKEDMQRDFQFRMADIENLLFEMEQRGQDFFDETFRLTRIFDLISKEGLQQAFEHRVVSDVPQQIERKVGELIDWLVDADLRQWQAVTEYLAERRREHQSRIVGDPGTSAFRYDRERLMDAVGREALRVIESYDKVSEAQSMAQSAQIAVAASAAIEVGAVGLGALITILATTLSVDVTGILMAGALAALGLFVIPARRRRAKSDMRAKVAELRTQLVQSLSVQFGREIEHSLQRINEAIAPYTRFVRAERVKMVEAQTALEEMRRQVVHLRNRIEVL